MLIWPDFTFLFWVRALAYFKGTLLEGGFFSQKCMRWKVLGGGDAADGEKWKWSGKWQSTTARAC